MRILLVEDDAAKRKALMAFLGARGGDATIVEATSFSSAMDALSDAAPDIVLLDMTIPSIERSTSDRDHTLVYGGRDVMRQLRRLGHAAHVIVVTQYEQFDEGPEAMALGDLDAQLREIDPDRYAGAVSFSFVYDSWKHELERVLQWVEQARHRTSGGRGLTDEDRQP
jgi:CheY-like chemotaxis protein